MTEQNPITPPPELVQQWWDDFEACCEWLKADGYPGTAIDLRATRRPKPPSLKEQALDALSAVAHYTQNQRQNLDTIRRALEALDD